MLHMPASLVEIFKAGTHTDANGVERTFTPDDIESIVSSYSAAESPAPLYIHHDESGDQKGFVGEVFRLGQSVVAKAANVADDFAGLFKGEDPWQLSVRLNPPSNDQGWSLRHLAAVPRGAVQMLPAEFSESNGVAITFASPEVFTAFEFLARDIRNIFTGMRDMLVEEFGAERVATVMPMWQLDALTDSVEMLSRESEPVSVSQFSQPTPGANFMTEEELQQRAAELDARQAELDQQAEEGRVNTFVQFAQAELDKGKQFSLAAATAVYQSLPNTDERVEFGEGDDKQSLSPRQAFKALLQSIPKSVEFGEFASSEGTVTGDDENPSPEQRRRQAAAAKYNASRRA